MKIRSATRKDLQAFHKELPFTSIALAAERNGELIGVGGYYYHNGHPVIFSGFADGLSKKEIVTGAKAIIGLLTGIQRPVYALQDDNDRAARTLAHFGFKPLKDSFWVLE
jgi:hypothetical protein